MYMFLYFKGLYGISGTYFCEKECLCLCEKECLMLKVEAPLDTIVLTLYERPSCIADVPKDLMGHAYISLRFTENRCLMKSGKKNS